MPSPATKVATIGDSATQLPKFNLEERSIPIRTELTRAARGNLDELKLLRVPTADGRSVPLMIAVTRLEVDGQAVKVFEGQTLTVQVIKDPIGTKGARLSTQVSIAGRMLVFLPQDTHIGISQKIGSHELREQLRARMQVLAGTDGGGFILRTNAEEANDTELADDIAYLRKTWTKIRERSHSQPAGTLLHQDLSLAERVLRDLTTEATQTIRIDSKVGEDIAAARARPELRRRMSMIFQGFF